MSQNYEVGWSQLVEKQKKNLRRKFKNFDKDFYLLIKRLKHPEEIPGTPYALINDFLNIKKMRWGIKTENIGRSGGLRIYFGENNLRRRRFIVAMYFKGDKEDLTESEKQNVIKDVINYNKS